MIWKQLVKLATTSDVLHYLQKFSAHVPYDVDAIAPVFAPTGKWVDDTDKQPSLKGSRNIIAKVMVLIDDKVPAIAFSKVHIKGSEGWVDSSTFDTIECIAERTTSCKGVNT